MIRFVAKAPSGRLHIGLGVDEEVIRRLFHGETVIMQVNDPRAPDIEISLTYGQHAEEILKIWQQPEPFTEP